MVIFEDDGHVKVFHSESHSLEVDSLDVLDVDHIEWEFADGDQAVLCWADLDHRFQGAAHEVELLVRHVELDSAR